MELRLDWHQYRFVDGKRGCFWYRIVPIYDTDIEPPEAKIWYMFQQLVLQKLGNCFERYKSERTRKIQK